MRPLILAFSFIRVPKLFVSLLFWPMVLGVLLALSQAVMSSAYLGIVTESPEDFEKRIYKETAEHQWLRSNLYGKAEVLAPLQVCRWQASSSGEQAPTDACKLEGNDVVIRTDSPESYDVTKFENFFQGTTRRIHLCRSCSSDIIISETPEGRTSDIYGLRALGVYILTDSEVNNRVGGHYVAAKSELNQLRDIGGTILLHPAGSEQSINMTQATKIMILILNIAAITIIVLWLALKGHRKVLQYFAQNGALLPLVAACGKNTFYAALWIITLLRVSLFLLAVIPSTVIVYSKAVPKETLDVFIKSGPEFVLWVTGIVASLSCLAIVASIAELKQRHTWVSFLYRYIPILLCFLGSVIWFVALFTEGATAKIVQNVIAAIPVIGISPMIVSPLFTVDINVIALHCALAGIMVVVLMRHNSQWFAAHLEEI